MQLKKKAIVWFTNNLRVQDNTILYEACSNYENVIGIYCFNKKNINKTQFGFKKIEKFRAKFLIESIQNLSQNLKKINIPLFTFLADSEQVIPSFCLKHNATILFFQKETTQEEQETINAVIQKLPEKTVAFSLYDQFLFNPEAIPFSSEKIPEVFSNFRKIVEKKAAVEGIKIIKSKKKTNLIDNDTIIPSLEDLGFQEFENHSNTAFPFKGGESEALNRLDDYFFRTKKLGIYKKTRNGLLGTDYSSKFSPWLANGSISARIIYWEIKKYEQQFGNNQSTYWLIFELIWRDYFKFLSLKHKNNLFNIKGIKQISYNWKNDDKVIRSWINGKTSNAFVNANMLELKHTGWMSNRGRQNVASFFTKELLLDWRIGAAYFESMLIDYDVHSNYGNWQYVAGVGNDPRNRKFNIQLQAERYDPHGKYRSLWLEPTLF